MEFLEVPLYDDDVFKLGVRFVLNAILLISVVLCALGPGKLPRNFAFPVVMMNLMAFFICFTMKKLDLGLGMALGLFAIFAVLRYRTQSIDVKQMTYLFIAIGIAVINALANKKTSYVELLAVNSAILLTAFCIERYLPRDRHQQQTVNYDRLELLPPDKRAELLADISQRTGLQVTEVELRRIDLQTGKATLSVTSQVPPKG